MNTKKSNLIHFKFDFLFSDISIYLIAIIEISTFTFLGNFAT